MAVRPTATPSGWRTSRIAAPRRAGSRRRPSARRTPGALGGESEWLALHLVGGVPQPVGEHHLVGPSGRSFGSSSSTGMIASGERKGLYVTYARTESPGRYLFFGTLTSRICASRASGVTRTVPLTFFIGTRSNGFSAAVTIGVPSSVNSVMGLTLTLLLLSRSERPLANSTVRSYSTVRAGAGRWCPRRTA